MSPKCVTRLAVHRLALPLRHVVTHAASKRRTSEPVLVSVQLSDGTVGYGETLPRRYVTGESVDSVMAAIERVYVPVLSSFQIESFPVSLAFIEALPWCDDRDAPSPAARAAVELALLDAVLRSFGKDMDSVVRWMGLADCGSPGSLPRIRYGGVLAAGTLKKTMRQLRFMYWAGLRAFKMKVGFDGDLNRLLTAVAYLQGGIETGRATIRVDANGAWTMDQARSWLRGVGHLPLAAIEQPLAKGDESHLPALKAATDHLLMHDESLVTLADAKRLVDVGVADAFNIRISKCGGLMASLRLAAFARRHGVRIQLGSMVGETSLLSAAGLRFLEVFPGVEWLEGCFGSFLLKADVTTNQLRFGFGGRPPRLGREGFGIEVDADLIARHAGNRSRVWRF